MDFLINGVLRHLLLALIAAGVFYSLFALLCLQTGLRPKRKYTVNNLPPVSILKPLKGTDPGLRENLISFCRQDYPEFEVLLGFLDENDEGVPVAKEVEILFPDKVRLVIGGEEIGANRKVSNLHGLAKAARYGMLAISDSDMRAGEDYLKTIVGEFISAGPEAGLVTSLYRISRPVSAGTALESLTIAADFIPSVMVARVVEGGISFGLGASMLISKEAFEKTGGFRAIADYLADDYQAGYRLTKKGYGVVLSGYVMEDVAGGTGLREYFLHQLRWARTYRASRPRGYLGYGVTHLLTYSLLFLVFWPGALSSSLLLLAVLLRLLTVLLARKKISLPARWLRWAVLLPVKDVISFGIWLWSFMGREVRWRGARFRVDGEGKLKRGRPIS
ncbi:MAG: bacteriohopanetetrol glucosamine biosynthesis glycosyltransferase HpnI [Nitrospiraceae bacterium]|nr:bacteriohopanetetrol glucosamine biosynthesis glycosyltransferase HpnI [Nitrospiraceae bacterium]